MSNITACQTHRSLFKHQRETCITIYYNERVKIHSKHHDILKSQHDTGLWTEPQRARWKIWGWLGNTLPAEMFGVTDFWLETRVIIKIFKKIIAGMKTKVFCIGKHKKKKNSLKRKNQNGRLKKSFFSNSANSQNYFVKISWLGPWISRIDWCEGHLCVQLGP